MWAAVNGTLSYVPASRVAGFIVFGLLGVIVLTFVVSAAFARLGDSARRLPTRAKGIASTESSGTDS
ncbi:hypothetical protein GCM10011584_07390 [Nocardioides phosphati]|uniref:Uncharacterized protein n=2 Tax=Nocardioides phosphati TaxID=1867775 RepID=A0ABQ2N674_9ACTN|nr:hypothetical protein GCM10011584_07390 [Nocardioides phosphati]